MIVILMQIVWLQITHALFSGVDKLKEKRSSRVA